VQECRGIVLDENDDWKIVCYPYTKFFNYGEFNAVKLDWNKPLKVSAKVDGTLVILYRYRGLHRDIQ
jgi:tRNA splicing ligase